MKRFGGQLILDQADLDLRHGDVAVLRGENGSGKTTLLNILTGNLEPDSGEISYRSSSGQRSYRFPRAWWQELNPFDHFTPEYVAREGVGRTWQDVRLFPTQSLRSNLTIAARGPESDSPLAPFLQPRLTLQHEARLNAEANEMLARLGLSGREESSADRVSLGQSKRVAIARAVAAGARTLFLDEPLAGLDQAGIRDVLELLSSLQRDTNVTLVIVEHVFNLWHVESLANVDLLLQNGKVTRHDRKLAGGSTRAVLPSVQSNAQTSFRQLLDDDLIVKEEPLAAGARLIRVRCPNAARADRSLLSVRGLRVRRGKRVIEWPDARGASGLDLDLFAGEVAFLQAPNGWGKTTLAECIMGALPAESGEIMLDGKPLDLLPTFERAQAGIRMVASTDNTFPNLTGREVLGLSGAASTDWLSKDLLRRRVSNYSGGQRQQLALASSVRETRPRLQIYDEPFSTLDENALKRISGLFRPEPNSAVLVVLPFTTLPSQQEQES